MLKGMVTAVAVVVASVDVGGGVEVIPFVMVPVLAVVVVVVLVSLFKSTGAGSDFALRVLSMKDTCVPASLETGATYSVAGFDVERRVASVGVCRSAIVASSFCFFLFPFVGKAIEPVGDFR